MLVFELTMPNRGSWNNQWSQQNERHIIVKKESDVFGKELLNQILKQEDFWYNWSDGWSACVSVKKMDARSANKLKKISAGFCGYDWMVTAITKYGEILTNSQMEKRREDAMKEKLL